MEIASRLGHGVAQRIRRNGLQGKTVSVKLRLSDFTTFTRQVTLPAPTADEDIIARESCTLLRREIKPRQEVPAGGSRRQQLPGGLPARLVELESRPRMGKTERGRQPRRQPSPVWEATGLGPGGGNGHARDLYLDTSQGVPGRDKEGLPVIAAPGQVGGRRGACEDRTQVVSRGVEDPHASWARCSRRSPSTSTFMPSGTPGRSPFSGANTLSVPQGQNAVGLQVEGPDMAPA